MALCCNLLAIHVVYQIGNSKWLLNHWFLRPTHYFQCPIIGLLLILIRLDKDGLEMGTYVVPILK